MRLFLIFTFLAAVSTAAFSADKGYEISVRIKDFNQKELYLGYYLGDKQYLRDTAVADAKGNYVFRDTAALGAGVYLVVLPPDNRWFQILVTEKEQRFSIQTSLEDLNKNISFSGSTENELFYRYLRFLAELSQQAEPVQKQIAETTDEAKKASLQGEIDAISKKVKEFQLKFVQENKGTLAAAIVNANINDEMPAFEGTDEEKTLKAVYYLRSHFWDRLDPAAPGMLRTPFLFEKLDYFVNKLHYQQPDSLAAAVDEVLARVRPSEETFRFYLVHFLNAFATAKLVGMDAVYVHLAEKYYAKGDAPWISEEQLGKIIENAQALKPLLIGKIAPDILMQRRDGAKIRLHEVQSPYTILYFWRHDCGHCKESTPIIKAFYENFKGKGVKIFAVCVKFREEIADCWKYVDENGTGDWIHTADPYLVSKYYTIYNVKTTPQIYILDAKKEIISKNIGAEQLEEVMTRIMEMNQN
ncbi:MAG: redoxin domain-containing protein [Saprospiraceae bacterium]|jgi:thiol-disulfide isomerase/thioredoxin